MATDASHFFLKIGQQVSADFEYVSEKGTRALHTALDKRNGKGEGNEKGWSLSEFLMYTDRKESSKDNLWVLEDSYEIVEDREIIFDISAKNATNFEVKRDSDGAEYKHIEYKIRVTISNFNLKFELIVPRSGTFNDLEQGGIRLNQQCDTQHIYELYSSSNSDRLV